MDDRTARRVHQLLNDVFAAPPEKRRSLVLGACAQDDSLASRKAELLAAIDESLSFLDESLIQREVFATPGAPAIPERVGRYKILRVLGSGGMATVYEAMQEQPQRLVALKVPHAHRGDPCLPPQFQYESEVLARLRHPAIAQVYEAGSMTDPQGQTIPYFALEFVPEARTLLEYCRERQASQAEKVRLFCEVCAGVQHGHRLGIIHRDLKPANLLVDREGHPKIIDFGLAQSPISENEERDAGRLFGTLNYMSPEQCTLDGEVDARTDIYSLGVVLFELLTGGLPHDFSRLTLPEALQCRRENPPRRPGELNSSIDRDLEAIIGKALATNPVERYGSVDALQNDLKRWLQFLPVEAAPRGTWHQLKLLARRNPFAVVASAGVLVAVILGSIFSGLFAYQMWRESKRREAAEQLALTQRNDALWQTYVANIAGAFSAFQTREFRQMRERLERAPSDHRGWEWKFLTGLADVSDVTLRAHEDMIHCIAVSPDQRFLVTGARDGAIKVWSLPELSLIQSMQVLMADASESIQLANAVHGLAIAPDGKRIAAGLGNGMVQVFDTVSGQPLWTRKVHATRILQLAWTGPWMAASSSDGKAVIWNPDAGSDSISFERLNQWGDRSLGDLHGVQFVPGGARLLVWSKSGALHLLNLERREREQLWELPHEIVQVVISPDGRQVAASCIERRIFFWEVDGTTSPREVTLPGSASSVVALAFSPDGSRLAAGRIDRGIQLVDVESGRVIGGLNGHEEAVSGIWFDESGERLISTSWDRSLRTWDLSGKSPLGNIRILSGHQDGVLSVDWSPDGAQLASGSRDGTISLWAADTSEKITDLVAARGEVMKAVYSPDGRFLASATNAGWVQIWDMQTNQECGRLPQQSKSIWSVEFSPDGATLAMAGDGRTVSLWNWSKAERLWEASGHSARITRLAWSPDGSRIASASRDHSVRIWDAKDGRLIHVLDGHASDVFSVVFNSAGDRLFSGSRDQTVKVWNVKTGRALHTLSGHGQFITSLALSPDGSRLAAGSWFGEVVFWDLQRLDLVATFKGHEQAIRDLTFSPDGHQLVTASQDRLLRVFDSRIPPWKGPAGETKVKTDAE